MARLILLTGLVFIGTNAFAQYNRNNYKDTPQQILLDSISAERQVYVNAKPTEFPGGIQNFFKFVSKHLKYPKDAKKQRIEGMVKVAFIVDSTGVIKKESVKVVQSVHPSCDDEAVRVIKISPKWIPGFSYDLKKNVNQWMIIPILFKLG